MNLIVRSDDERLEFDTLCAECGPRPLLDEDGVCKTCGMPAQGPGTDVVMQSLRAALLAKEEAERRACRVREALAEFEGAPTYNYILFKLKAALSASGPCECEEELKRYKAAVEWAIGNLKDSDGNLGLYGKELSRRIAEGGKG